MVGQYFQHIVQDAIVFTDVFGEYEDVVLESQNALYILEQGKHQLLNTFAADARLNGMRRYLKAPKGVMKVQKA